MTSVLQSPPPPDGHTLERLQFAAGDYHHPASGSLDLRLVRRGSSYADIDLGAGLRRIFTRPGDLLVTLPDRATRFTIVEDREVTLIAIGAALAAELMAAVGGTLDELLPLSRPPLRHPLVAGLCRSLEVPDVPPGLVRFTLGAALGQLLLRARQAGADAIPALSHRRVAVVTAAVDADLGRGWQVDDLAALAGLPRRAFTGAFKEATGLPAYQFVMQRRIEAALHLLRTSSLPVAQIASRTGFTHQAHFTRVLRRLSGSTPGQIRKETAKLDGQHQFP